MDREVEKKWLQTGPSSCWDPVDLVLFILASVWGVTGKWNTETIHVSVRGSSNSTLELLLRQNLPLVPVPSPNLTRLHLEEVLAESCIQDPAVAGVSENHLHCTALNRSLYISMSRASLCPCTHPQQFALCQNGNVQCPVLKQRSCVCCDNEHSQNTTARDHRDFPGDAGPLEMEEQRVLVLIVLGSPYSLEIKGDAWWQK
ncbi:uncharacterized protein LOC143695114 [Agelaius phoeniceus]|uniref:uncharacterized protein LOC143695114 n=1 Tax=Agelaius phoeniceus TaxID=39638 RepID=UPI004054FDB5